MNIKDINILNCNSFFCSTLIAHFVSGSNNEAIRSEYIYLLLPFIFKKESREILINARKNSSLSSLFLQNENGKITLAGGAIQIVATQPWRS